MSAHTTWKVHETHGQLSTKEKDDLPESVFAFPNSAKSR